MSPRLRFLAPEERPQDPTMDGSTLVIADTYEHGGAEPDMMPQAIRITDAEGRSAIYVPLTFNGHVVEVLSRCCHDDHAPYPLEHGLGLHRGIAGRPRAAARAAGLGVGAAVNLAALPRISAAGFHALFDGQPLVAVEAHVVDDAALQVVLPDARALIVEQAGTDKGRSAAFVITDPPPLPEGVDPVALTVALTFVKD